MSANGSCILRVVLSPWKMYDVALTWSFKDRVAAAALQAHFLPRGCISASQDRLAEVERPSAEADDSPLCWFGSMVRASCW